jgi:hypothetical protein
MWVVLIAGSTGAALRHQHIEFDDFSFSGMSSARSGWSHSPPALAIDLDQSSDHYRMGESLNPTRGPIAAFTPSLIVSDLIIVALED